MARLTDTTLPVPGDTSQANTWGARLNAYLGYLKNGVQQQAYNVKDYGAVGDGTTDDQAAIQDAVDACYAAGGGVVFLPPGTYKVIPVKPAGFWIEGGIWLYSGVQLVGAGFKSIIKLGGEGNLICVDRNEATHDDMGIFDMVLDGNHADYTLTDPYDGNNEIIMLENASRCRFQRLYLKESYGYGIFMSNGCYDLKFTDNILLDIGAGGRAADAIFITNRCARIQATHNLIARAASNGIRVTNEGPFETQDWEISGNTIIECAYFGIQIYDGDNTCDTTDGATQGGVVISNTIRGCGTVGSGFRGGIQVANVQHTVGGGGRTHLQDIIVAHNNIYDCQNHGLTLRQESGGNVRRIQVTGNHIHNNTGVAIYMYAATAADLSECVLSGNTYYNNSSGGITVAGTNIQRLGNCDLDNHTMDGTNIQVDLLGVGSANGDAGYWIDTYRSRIGGEVAHRVGNSDNTNGASGAGYYVVTGGGSGGDPLYHAAVTGGAAYSFGVDNSDADAYVLFRDGIGNNYMRIDRDTGAIRAHLAAASSHDYAAGTTAWTMTETEAQATLFVVTNASGGADAVFPAAIPGKTFTVYNNSGQTITFKVSGQAGVASTNAKYSIWTMSATDCVKVFEQS